MSSTLKEQAKMIFQNNRQVTCPAFPNEFINFNGKGLNHLFFKAPRSKRAPKEISTRVYILPRAVELLKKSGIPQEEDGYIGYNGKVIKFWAFWGVIKHKLVKVIVRQVGNGNKHFWSAIPWWRKSRFGNKNCRTNLSNI